MGWVVSHILVVSHLSGRSGSWSWMIITTSRLHVDMGYVRVAKSVEECTSFLTHILTILVDCSTNFWWVETCIKRLLFVFIYVSSYFLASVTIFRRMLESRVDNGLSNWLGYPVHLWKSFFCSVEGSIPIILLFFITRASFHMVILIQLFRVDSISK